MPRRYDAFGQALEGLEVISGFWIGAVIAMALIMIAFGT
jgi:hypothetical protein